MKRLATPFTYLLLTLLALIFVAPILFMVVSSLKPDEMVLSSGLGRAFTVAHPSLANYADVMERLNFPRVMGNSLLITSAIVASGLLVNSLAGYSLARLRWRGRRPCLILILALLIIPFEAIAVPLFFQVTLLGWRDSYQVQIIPFIADAFSIFLFYSFFLDIPAELEEAAAMDGAGPWRTFFLIVLPTAKPVFATVAVLTFLMRWGSYLWPLLVTVGETYRPLPVAMAAFENQVKLWGDIMAFGVMMVLPVLILFLLCQRWLISGIAATSTGHKG
ncbi:MAG: carbohydrate ABC transporter permease [Thermodesulfobacteriota bacterium]